MAIINLTESSFEATIQANELVIIDFWAEWCAPCLAFSPIFEKVSQIYPDITFAKVNIEIESQLAADFHIRSVPMLMVFKKNVIVFAESGVLTSDGLKELVEQAKILDMTDVLSQNEEIK